LISGVKWIASFKVARYGTKGLSRPTFNLQLLKVTYNLSNIYIHWAGLNASATPNTSNILKLLWEIEELVREALPQPSPPCSPGVVTPGGMAKTWGLTTVPAPYSFYFSLIRIVPHIKTIAGGANIGTDVAMQAAVSKSLPIRVIKELPYYSGDPLGGDSLRLGWSRQCSFILYKALGQQPLSFLSNNLNNVAILHFGEQDIYMARVIRRSAHASAKTLWPGLTASDSNKGRVSTVLLIQGIARLL